jgi:hypothetical protein
MLSFSKSDNLTKTSDFNNQPIHLFQQFFIHSDPKRQEEIKFCLKQNVENNLIDKIYLLNERIYKEDDLGISSNKIIQKKIKTRLSYKKLFNYIHKKNIKGYIVFSNSDIFLDDTIDNIRRTHFHKNKNFIGLLRYDYDVGSKKSKIFGPRFDSQDTWIIHTDYLPNKDILDIFDFQFGKPGCDNKLIYLMKILGYKMFNIPKLIKTYHVHKSQTRDYSRKDLVPRPHIYIEPYGFSTKKSNIEPYMQAIEMTENLTLFNYDDNLRLYNFITDKMNTNKTFYIPKLLGIECFYSYAVNTIIKKKVPTDPEEIKKILKAMEMSYIYYDDPDKSINYCILYDQAIKESEVYTCYEKFHKENSGIIEGIEYFQTQYPEKNKVWENVFNIGAFIKYYPWTIALSCKKILIISQFAKQISDQGNNTEYYGVNLFPNCKIQCLDFQPKRINDYNSDQIISIYMENLKEYDFDIVLLDTYGYGNILAHYIWKIMGKSAINVGEMLPLFFGIYNDNYEKEHSDIMKLYKNEKWLKI